VGRRRVFDLPGEKGKTRRLDRKKGTSVGRTAKEKKGIDPCMVASTKGTENWKNDRGIWEEKRREGKKYMALGSGVTRREGKLDTGPQRRREGKMGVRRDVVLKGGKGHTKRIGEKRLEIGREGGKRGIRLQGKGTGRVA